MGAGRAARITAIAVPVGFLALCFGWPLVVGGLLKACYDVLLLLQFRAIKPAGEP